MSTAEALDRLADRLAFCQLHYFAAELRTHILDVDRLERLADELTAEAAQKEQQEQAARRRADTIATSPNVRRLRPWQTA